MSTTAVSSQRSIYEKRKVMSAAKHPIESSLGKTLLKTNFQDDRTLSAEIYKLDKLKKRLMMHSNQEKKSFLHGRSLPEPMLIVERPVSPNAAKKFETRPQSDHPSRPRYMHQLQSRVRTPSHFVTIDAFSVKTRKKVNLWEEGLEGEVVKFESPYVPSSPLTKPEIVELQKACIIHPGFQRPLSATGERIPDPFPDDPLQRDQLQRDQLAKRSKSRNRKKRSKARKLSPKPDPDAVFITELPLTSGDQAQGHPAQEGHMDSGEGLTDRAIRTVSFANNTKRQQHRNEKHPKEDQALNDDKVALKQKSKIQKNMETTVSIGKAYRILQTTETMVIPPSPPDGAVDSATTEVILPATSRSNIKDEIRKWIKESYNDLMY